jgi:DNA-binding response OmpR family regulator
MSVSKATIGIYVAIKKPNDRSSIEDALVLDGINVSTFASAEELWNAFQQRPVRMVLSDRRFGTEFDGFSLARRIRKSFSLPHVFVVILGAGSRVTDIEESLASGADDYLIKPYNPAQIRSRVLIGIRWLRYIDSLFKKDAPAPI